MSQPPQQPYPGPLGHDDPRQHGYPPAGGDAHRGHPERAEATERWSAAGPQQSYPGQGAQQSYPGQSPHQSYPGQNPQQSYPGQNPQGAHPGYEPGPGAYSGHGQGSSGTYSGYGSSPAPNQSGWGEPTDRHGGYTPPTYPPDPSFSQPYAAGTDAAQSPYQQPGPMSGPGYGQPATDPYGTPSASGGYGQAEPYAGYPQNPGGVPQGGYPGGPPPAKKSKVGRIVLLAVVGVLVLCGGGVTVAALALKDDVQDSVEAARTTVVAPATLAGRPKITDPELQKVADDMVASMKREITNETGAVGAFYGDPAKRDMVMVAAASGRVIDPGKEVDDAFREIQNSQFKLSNLVDIEPGPLGGVARCGDAVAGEIQMGICIWADKGSVGVIGIYFQTAEKVKAEFAKLRGEVEKRS